MKNRIGKCLSLLVFSVAMAALLCAPAVNAENPVRRPFQISGQLTTLDLYGSFPMTVLGQGMASGLGKFVDICKIDGLNSGFGIIYAADGDRLFYRVAGPATMVFTGGTGRFANATGSFDYTMDQANAEYIPGPGTTLTVTVMYTGKGTITY